MFLEGSKELGNRPHVVLLCFQGLGRSAEFVVCWQGTAVRAAAAVFAINLLFLNDRHSSTINPAAGEG